MFMNMPNQQTKLETYFTVAYKCVKHTFTLRICNNINEIR